MPQDYFSLVTNQGLIKEAASNEPGGTAINLTEMAVGDSNGTYYDPDGSETALANEVHRVTLTHVVVDENNTNQLIVEAVLDETIGPFYIREVGIFDSNGDLFAIGKYPETFKPNLPAGSGKRLYIRMILGFANSPNVNLVINNDIALDPNFSTDVNNALAERLIKTNNLSDLDDVDVARSNINAQQDVIANRGSISRGDINGDAEELLLGSQDKILVSDGNDVKWDFPTIPVFRAKLENNQVVVQNSLIKAILNNKLFDSHNWFDNITNYRYTPQREGYYQFNAACFGINFDNRMEIIILKNSSAGSTGYSGGVTADMGAEIADIMYMNGSSDYIELYLRHFSSTSKTFQTDTWLSGFYIGK